MSQLVDSESLPSLVARFSVRSPNLSLIESLAEKVNARVEGPFGEEYFVNLVVEEVQIRSSSVIERAVNRISSSMQEIVSDVAVPSSLQEAHLEVRWTIFPNDDMNAGFFLPSDFIRFAAVHHVAVYVGAL